MKQVPMRCQVCGITFTATILSGGNLAVYISLLETLKCPSCGAAWDLLAFAPEDTPNAQ